MTTDRFETTFSIAASPDVVWTRLDQRDGDGHWLLPAFEGLGEEIDVETGSRLHVRKVTEPCAGSEIVIVLEHEASGTKVTVSQSGFPAWFAFATDAFAIGWRHIVADLALYLDRGVRGDRHARTWAMLGCSLLETTVGLEVIETMPGTLADKIGLVAGDVLLTVGGAPIVTRAELETMMRISGGQEIEVEWAHGDEKLAATGTL
jgi:PDZ domain